MKVGQEGQTITVEVYRLAAMLRDTKENQELEMVPGPLNPGVTYKNNVIKLCERNIAACRGRRTRRATSCCGTCWCCSAYVAGGGQ